MKRQLIHEQAAKRIANTNGIPYLDRDSQMPDAERISVWL